MTKTTNDIAFLLYNSGDVDNVRGVYLYNPKMLFVVEIAEYVWKSNGRLRWNYSDRIIITPITNLKRGITDNDSVKFLRYQDLAQISTGIQQSVLNNLRRYAQKWQNV